MKQSDAQVLGRKGQRWFESQLPREWVFQRPTEDFGIDGVVVIGESGPLNGIEFRVQIKASERWDRQNGLLILPKIKRHTVRDWLAGLSPAMLALYEEATDTGFICWVFDLFETPVKIKELITGTTGTLTLKIPTDCPINATCWESVRQRLTHNYESVCNGLQAARLGQTVLPLMRTLAECAKNLHVVQVSWDPCKEDKKNSEFELLMLLEVTSHREVVAALKKFAGYLPPDILLSRQVESLVETFITEVSEFYNNFPYLVDHPDENVVVATDPKALVRKRPYMLSILLDLLIRFGGLAGTSSDGKPYHEVANPFPYPWATLKNNTDG